MNKVVAVVLNYNTAKDSKKCLEYLLKQDYSGYGKMKLAALMFSDRIYCLIKCKGREN